MSRAVGNEVVEFSTEFEKFSVDMQSLIDGIKEEFRKIRDESRELQSSQNDRIQNIEATFYNDVQNIKDRFQDLQQSFETFKQETARLVEESLSSNQLDQNRFNQLLAEHSRRLEEVGQFQGQLAKFTTITPEKLREELIAGIHMLGERISKAIDEINQRVDNFAHDFQDKISLSTTAIIPVEQGLSEPDRADFAPLKESALFEMTDYEIVPKEAIKKLSELFRKQSLATKNFIEKHELRVQEFERLLKAYDEENTHLLELLDRRVKRNFRISMLAIVIVIIFLIISRIF